MYLGVDESALYLPAVLEGVQPDALLLSVDQLSSANAAQVQSLAASLTLPVMLRAVAAEPLRGGSAIDALARQLGWHALQGSFADALQQIHRVLGS
ncbi:hypothetical protein GYB62_01085 [bacterium]|nr:hypothetical protein [bacterium]